MLKASADRYYDIIAAKTNDLPNLSFSRCKSYVPI